MGGSPAARPISRCARAKRVKESIIRGAYYLLDETYSDEVKGFRYTSCPNTKYSPGASPLMVEGINQSYS